MDTEIQKIGMREFREHMQQYLKSSSPLAITRHGETVGFYIPTHQPEHSDIENLKKAALKLDMLLESEGLTEEDLLAEFRRLRTSRD